MIFILIVIGVLFVASEIGLRVGFLLHAKRDEARKSQIGGVQGAVIGLLGLLLAFTFSMSVGRHDARQGMVLKEANVIGTAWLRADFLDSPHLEEAKGLLRKYIDLRVEIREVSDDAAKLAAGQKVGAEIQEQLWSHALAFANQDRGPLSVAFLASINELIDTDTERVAIGLNHIPVTVWVLVITVSAFGCFTSSYGSGAHGARSLFTSLFLPLLISVVISLINDIDQPLRGSIGVEQQPMLDVQANISE